MCVPECLFVCVYFFVRELVCVRACVRTRVFICVGLSRVFVFMCICERARVFEHVCVLAGVCVGARVDLCVSVCGCVQHTHT